MTSAVRNVVDSAACSVLSEKVDEPLAGTAPEANGWLILEDPGPWGRDALRDSTIPTAVADFCDELRAEHGIRVVLARHATRRRLSGDAPRNVWLAHCAPKARSLQHTLVDSLHEIIMWDPLSLARGDIHGIGQPVRERLEFICTHSGRDACCAILGRARADASPTSWECSHLGGHRFAATSLVLPDGQLFGRLDASGSPQTANSRGACYLSPPLQVAEIAVRTYAGLDPFTTVQTRSAAPPARGGATVEAIVSCDDGRSWQVLCEADQVLRPASCHEEARMATIWRAVDIVEGEHSNGR